MSSRHGQARPYKDQHRHATMAYDDIVIPEEDMLSLGASESISSERCVQQPYGTE